MPAFGVMTTNFVSAAELMAKVLGMPGYAFAIIDHPVSSATDAGLRERAIAALKQGSGLLVR
ncbi:MAG: hypothetical protein KF889_07775 [Alphaproteobacteria bacterium]|nr:hypothetical protein [Alphaproteobacteria bacterium]MCW5740717.1 hypothetical protein [Alphaproteobacteria bacterium]